ncbi:MAG: AAA family ATPase [Desulfobacterales bacterium]|nr:AAA family ATPase [Desulfobacterales bacterium]
MMKKFNYTGVCIPEKHYMVNISNKLAQIIALVEEGEYFTINRPRQYGKTTTLYLLAKELKKRDAFLVLKMSFEGTGDESFSNEASFNNVFLKLCKKAYSISGETELLPLFEQQREMKNLNDLSEFITEFVITSGRKVVLLIDEVDSSSNNQLFLYFLGMLRNKYLSRNQGDDSTFHSVILVGVHDVRNLKLKIRPDGERQYNSPWNIAADFKVDLSFSPEEISTMLQEYCTIENVKMDVRQISEKLYYYTSGYPFLVSKLCRIIHDDIMPKQKITEWTAKHIEEAVQIILYESNTNFESLIKNIENNQDLYQAVYQIIIDGVDKIYNLHNPLVGKGIMYGIFNNDYKNTIKIHNRIYEQVIYNYLSSKMETTLKAASYNYRDNFLQPDGYLDFSKLLLKFQEFMHKEYSEKDLAFLERNGRLIFLAFLKPIINGKGYDFKEVQISEEKRLDVVVTYLDRHYVIELKIWHGPEAHTKGLLQLSDYLQRRDLLQGYLIIFDFRGKKEWKQEWTRVDNKDIFMVWV